MTNKRSIEDDSQSDNANYVNNGSGYGLNGETDLKKKILDLKWGGE